MVATSSVQAQITTYEVNYEVAGSVKNWSDSATWKPGPGGYPDAADDHVIFLEYTGAGGARTLEVDLATLEIGKLEATGAGSTRRLRSGAADASLTLELLKNSGTGSLTLSNGSAGSLFSISVGTLDIASGGTIEIGNSALNGLAAFEVSGTSTVNGIFVFGGVGTAGNRVKLGALELNGSLAIGGRGNMNGVVETNALTGSGSIYQANATHNGNNGTLLINSEAGTKANYSGALRISSSTSFDTTGYSLALQKSGAGTQIFSRSSGLNHNGGTIIDGGVLAITNATGSGLGTGAAEVRATGTLAGSGIVQLEGATTTVKSGGTLAPSAHLESGLSKLTFNGALTPTGPMVSLESGATLRFRLEAGNFADEIAFTNYHAGGLQLAEGGVNLAFDNTTAGTFTLLSFDAIDAGEIAGLLSKFQIQETSGFSYALGHDVSSIFVEVTAVPEPSTVALLSLFGVAVGVRMLRR